LDVEFDNRERPRSGSLLPRFRQHAFGHRQREQIDIWPVVRRYDLRSDRIVRLHNLAQPLPLSEAGGQAAVSFFSTSSDTSKLAKTFCTSSSSSSAAMSFMMDSALSSSTLVLRFGFHTALTLSGSPSFVSRAPATVPRLSNGHVTTWPVSSDVASS